MFQKLLEKIAKELNNSQIPYMIIGGQAVLMYGEPRLTKDIDITLGVGIDKFKTVEQIIKNLGFKILVENPEAFIKEFMIIPALDEESSIKIDFIFSFTPYETQAINRSKKVKFGNTNINFASIEDLIIHKIIAGRARDLEDVRMLLVKNKKFDKDYIVKWLGEFDKSLGENFSDKFNRILEELK